MLLVHVKELPPASRQAFKSGDGRILDSLLSGFLSTGFKYCRVEKWESDFSSDTILVRCVNSFAKKHKYQVHAYSRNGKVYLANEFIHNLDSE